MRGVVSCRVVRGVVVGAQSAEARVVGRWRSPDRTLEDDANWNTPLSCGVVSDLELLQSWKDGDRTAADELIARYFDPICRFFRSKLGDDVDDLIQRTFLDCLAAHERFRGEGSFRSYLFSIAHHRLFDHLRRAQRRPVLEDLGAMSIQDLGTTPSRAAARGQETEVLRAALDALALDHRIALELAYWEDMSGPEIAIALGIGANTVRSRLARARVALREAIEAVAGDDAARQAGLADLERITRGPRG